MLSSAVVGLILLHTAFLFPAQTGWIVLVGVGWVIFGRSMAEKAVTLVGVQSASGEIEKIPRGRRWAAQLGMLTFAIGILGQQWHIAVMGIVFSWMTAAAIWQNFRARLPFLYDPWSETLPSPPTLMHAMVAISILVEAGAFFSGVFQAFFGRAYVAVAQAVAYGLCSVVVAFCTWNFLNNRGVSLTQVIHWPRGEQKGVLSGLVPGLLAAVAGGLLIGLSAHGYTALLHHIPAADAMLRRSDDEIAKIFAFKESYFVMAVVFAPFAEEYLFRGLLYRALDREWGGWQAVLGSAAFFATYHHPLFWLPVGLLGAANAWIFKKTGRLEPAVLMHMVYNAVALS
jgi:membrane protease YdiL (CAAX protease family)